MIVHIAILIKDEIEQILCGMILVCGYTHKLDAIKTI